MTMKYTPMLLALFALALTACSEQDKGERAVERFELFELVPADTPYVAASSRALPEALSRRLLQAAALQNDKREFRLAMKEVETEDPGEKRLVQLAQAVNQELKGKLNPEGLDSLGFPLNGRSLIYGLGILPVAWIEIEDGNKVKAFLDRVEQRAGQPSQRLKQGSLAYRRYDFGALSGVAAVKEGYLVVALLPAAGEQQLLPLALGQQKPERSLDGAGTFRKFVSNHGFLGYGEGYVDLQRLLEMALGEAGGVNAQVLQSLGFEPEAVSPGCRRLARHLVQSVPRFSFGYIQAKADGYTVEGVLETSPAVGAWLKRMAAPVPGLGSATGATFSLGLGLNLPKVRDGIKAMLAAVLEQGKECEDVDQEELAQAMQSVDLLLNPMLAGVKGFNLVLDQVVLDTATLEPKSVKARLVVAATDPRGLFGVVGVLDPRLAMLQIPPDGTPVELPLKDSLPAAPPAWVATKGEVLGLFLDAQPPGDTTRVLSEPPASSTLILALDYDVKKLLQQIGPSLERTMQTMQGEEAEDAREIYQAIKETAALYDRFSFGIHGEERGLVMRGKVEFGGGGSK